MAGLLAQAQAAPASTSKAASGRMTTRGEASGRAERAAVQSAKASAQRPGMTNFVKSVDLASPSSVYPPTSISTTGLRFSKGSINAE